jgi:ribulose-5-phosphate 4-epimerase/fuculose-1-phosphate aldolase
MADKDKNTRYELSALYRILHMYGMTDLANQCAGARSSENKDHSFVHPYGMFYEEITASSLVKINKPGKAVDSSSPWLNDGCINLAQWIFNAREDVNFYVHGHAEDVMAVGGTEEGLMYLSQAAVYLNHLIGYLDYEFIEDDDFGKKFMSLIKQHDILITRNHGYYVVGKTASEAFFRAYYLEQACSVQVKNLSMGLKTQEIDKQKAAYFWDSMHKSSDYNYDGKTEWAALLRKLDRENSDYKI